MEFIDPVIKESPFIKSISLEIIGIYEYSVFMLKLCNNDIELAVKDSLTDRTIRKFNNILSGKIPFYTSMTQKQRIKRMLFKAENFFTSLINIQPDMDTFTHNNKLYVVEFNVPDECYMEHCSCDTYTRTYRERARIGGISDEYLEESKDDESENESDDKDDDDYRRRLSGLGRRVRQRIRWKRELKKYA